MRNALIPSCVLLLVLLAGCNSEPQKPQAQQDFAVQMADIKKAYKAGDTKAQRDASKKSAVETRGQLFTRMASQRDFENWVCKVKEVKARAQGGMESLQLFADCGSFDMYNYFTSGDVPPFAQQIDKSSPLYNTLMQLKKSDTVVLSGAFQMRPRSEMILETSLTESGGMDAPEMAVAFTKVSPAGK